MCAHWPKVIVGNAGSPLPCLSVFTYLFIYLKFEAIKEESFSINSSSSFHGRSQSLCDVSRHYFSNKRISSCVLCSWIIIDISILVIITIIARPILAYGISSINYFILFYFSFFICLNSWKEKKKWNWERLKSQENLPIFFKYIYLIFSVIRTQN